MRLMLFLDSVHEALVAEECGLDRAVLDLEVIGKADRQSGRSGWMTTLSIESMPEIRASLVQTELMVRINPMGPYSKREIDAVINGRADRIMLPMARSVEDVVDCLDLIDERAKFSLLVETAQCLSRLPWILEDTRVDEVHLGLNDLSIQLEFEFMFELVKTGLIQYCAKVCQSAGVRFGFGGVARLGMGVVPAELVLAEHILCGSSQVILTRDFKSVSCNADQMKFETEKIRQYCEYLTTLDTATIQDMSRDLVIAIDDHVANLRF